MFVCVHFDLQNKSRSTLNQILQRLAEEIVQELLQLNPNKESLKKLEFVHEQNHDKFSEFLTQVYQEIGNKNLLLLLDEFDVLNDAPNPNLDIVHKGSGFFDYLQSLIKNKNEKLFIIPVLGRNLNDMPNIRGLFKSAPYQEIGLLDTQSAEQLITKPARGFLEYDSEAIKAILELSAGHPYFTQVICSALFEGARERNNNQVRYEDVEDQALVNKAIERAEGVLPWFWHGLSKSEQVIFSAVAAIEQNNGFPEDPLDLLKSYRVPSTESLTQAAEQLVERGFLDNTPWRVKIKFVRHWLILHHPLQQEIQNLERLEPQEALIPNVTVTQHQQGEKQNGLASDQQVLRPSPNSSSSFSFSKPTLILFGSMVAVVAAILLRIAIYGRVTPSPADPVSCVADLTNNISHGEKTIFPEIFQSHPGLEFYKNRNDGIEALKQGDYLKAATSFQNAVKANKNDPEVLIYYNNALARKKNSFFTLAVIAPVNKVQFLTAQEILRGVAQAQDKFNKERKANEQLLEIAIANDADQPDKAQQVAAKLVQDKNVLGVIGHYSSEATKTALPEYQKAEVPIISFSTSTELKGQKSPVLFRAVPSDASGEKLADYAASQHFNKVVIFTNPHSSYSKSIQEKFTDKFKSLRGTVVREIDLTNPKLDANEEVKSSLKAQVQAAVLFPDPQHTCVALKIAKANASWMKNSQNTDKSGLKLLGGDSLYGDYNSSNLSEYKEDVEGLILAVPWFRDAPKSRKFAEEAKTQWGGDVSWRTSAGFDATQAFIKALGSSPNPSRKTVLEGLRKVNLPSSETSGEPLNFTPYGESNGKPVLVKVGSGGYKFVK